MKLSHSPFSLRRVGPRWTLAVWAGLFLGVLSGANRVDAASLNVDFEGATPSLSVKNNTSVYTVYDGTPSPSLSFKVRGDAGFGLRIKTMSWEAGASVDVSGVEIGAGDESDREPDPGFGFRNRRQTMNGWIGLDTNALVGACNQLATVLRGQGVPDSEIYGEDRVLQVSVWARGSMSTTSTFSVPPNIDGVEVDLVCKKWAGSTVPSGPDQVVLEDGVTRADLTLSETSNLVGACKVTLQTQIETTQANMPVRFRYVHGSGVQSDVKEVTTSAAKVALTSHTYDIPNGRGREKGSIRIVGVNPEFTSNRVRYDMNCVEQAANDYQIARPPTAHMQGRPTGKKTVRGQHCPTHLQLQGKVQGRGDDTTGKALFFGPGVLSPLESFSIGGNESETIGYRHRLTWAAQGPQLAAPGGGPMPLMTQTVQVGFRVVANNNVEITSVPQRSFSLSCEHPPGPMDGAPGGLSGNGTVPVPTAPTPVTAGRGTLEAPKGRSGPRLSVVEASSSTTPAQPGGPRTAAVGRTSKGKEGRDGARAEADRVVRAARTASRVWPSKWKGFSLNGKGGDGVAAAKAVDRQLEALASSKAGRPRDVAAQAKRLEAALNAFPSSRLQKKQVARTCQATAQRCSARCDGGLCVCASKWAECLAPLLRGESVKVRGRAPTRAKGR